MAGIGWYFRYGSYRHDDCECWFSEDRQEISSADKVPTHIACRWDIHGRLHADTPAALKAKELALLAAYRRTNQDAGWYVSAGGSTVHQVTAAQTIRGVRVSRPPYFPESKGAEGSTFRTYALTLEWEEPVASPGILVQEQSIKIIGNGGPDWDIIAGVVGAPIEMPKTERSRVTVVQSGRAVGCNFYPPPAAPYWTNTPPLHGPSMQVDRYKVPGPDRQCVVAWSYTFLFSYLPSVRNP